MRERRPEDWRTDLAQRHALESRVERAFERHSGLTLLKTSTASTDKLDYQLLGPGEHLLQVELKTKRQTYKGWDRYRPDIPERDLFILDELALRRIVEAGRYAFLLAFDMNTPRWCLWTTADLVLTSKERVARRLATGEPSLKGKVLISLTEQCLVLRTMERAIDAMVEATRQMDARWNDISPWPRGVGA
ncbi:MAG: hypothetical protein M3285_12075 [Actinomycetota bacterium]|nr:hypothetical protein [Actinomycetota bacterium]